MTSTFIQRTTRSLGLALLGLLFLVPSAAEAGLGKYHEDERIGFKIKPPKDWSFVAMGADEEWIVGKFTGDREYTYNDKVNGTMTHRPDMTAITFIDRVVNKKKIEKSEDDEGSVLIQIRNPFKNYKDYLKRTFSGGGWYVSAEEEDEVNGISVTKLEIKVEKLTYTGPKRLVTWIYHLDGVDLAVQFQMLEGAYDKLKGDVKASLKSLRTIQRTKALTTETTGAKKWVNEDKMTPDARRKYRQEQEAKRHKKAIDSLPDDWKVEQMGRFLVLLHGDKKFAKRIVKQADSMWKWLDKTFPFFGKGEYVPSPIVRICKDGVEERAFLSGTSWWNSTEIVTHRDPNSGAGSWEFKYVNQRVVSIWFRNRNRDAWWAAPWWFSGGIDQVIGEARLKGSKIEFEVGTWERDALRESEKKGELKAPKELVMLTKAQFRKLPNGTYQSSAFVRFLLSTKNKKYRKLLANYLEGLQKVVAEAKKEEDKDKPSSSQPKTEEEEEEMMRRRSEKLKEKEEEFLQKVFDHTFSELSDKDWKRLKDAYFKSL